MLVQDEELAAEPKLAAVVVEQRLVALHHGFCHHCYCLRHCRAWAVLLVQHSPGLIEEYLA